MSTPVVAVVFLVISCCLESWVLNSPGARLPRSLTLIVYIVTGTALWTRTSGKKGQKLVATFVSGSLLGVIYEIWDVYQMPEQEENIDVYSRYQLLMLWFISFLIFGWFQGVKKVYTYIPTNPHIPFSITM